MKNKSLLLKNNVKIKNCNKKDSKLFKCFLLEQISKPKDKWSDEFKKFIRERREEARELELDNSPKLSLKENQIKVYENYLRDLSVEYDSKYFKDKDVIDLGCGDGEFVLECLEKKQVKSIYGIDLHIKKEIFSGRYRDNFIEDDFTEKFPFKRADRIVSDGGVNDLIFDENGADNLEKLFRNSIDILSDNGEIRIAPIYKYPHSNIELVGLDCGIKKLSNILEKLSEENLIEYKFEPIDIQVSGKDYSDVWLWETLIIKKKNN